MQLLLLASMFMSLNPQSPDTPAVKIAPPKGYVCLRTDTAPVIDGKLDEAAWRAAPWTTDFVDIQGPTMRKPRFRTRAKMLWDRDYFYIAAELEEPHVWGTLTQHDSVIFQDNDFEVFIDPDGDNHDYYEIEINALNTEWDLRLVKPYRDGGPALNEWEIPGFKSGVHVQGTLNEPHDTDKEWTVEMAIPWKALGEFSKVPAPPREGDQWRVNFSRVEWETVIVNGKYRKVAGKPEDNWVWSPQYVIDMHRPERWGYVQFTELTSEKGGRGVRFQRDTAEPARELLHRIYYAQKAFREQNKTWAATVAALGIADQAEIRLTQDGYEASVVVHDGQTRKRWLIRQDSRVWSEELRK